MKKNGFTLVELIAVIVILVLIIVIVLPKINSSFKESKRELAYTEANRLANYFDEYYARMVTKGDFSGCFYDFDTDSNNCRDFSFSFGKPSSGYVSLDSYGVLSGSFSIGEYEFIIEKGDAFYAYNFDYTGSSQIFNVPFNGYYKIELWGAQGSSKTGSIVGGKGAYVSGVINLDSRQVLYIYVGESSSYTSGSCYTSNPNNAFNASKNGSCSSGGGATDIRLIKSDTWYDFDSLASRIMVASGGGGALYNGYGGAAGGLEGYDGNGNGGTDVTHSGKYFGYSTSRTTTGGGGYYGGISWQAANSSGGSSFISGHNGCDAISESSTSNNIVHTGSSIHYSNMYFTNTVMIDGLGYSWTDQKGDYVGQVGPDFSISDGHTGNGYARIIYLGESFGGSSD